jgi:hypothetical protein
MQFVEKTVTHIRKQSTKQTVLRALEKAHDGLELDKAHDG